MKPLNILFIEEHKEYVHDIVRQLNQADFDINYYVVSLPRELQRHLEDQQTDFVIADFEHGRMDPFDSLKRVRANAPNLPFIFIADELNRTEVINATQAGANDFIARCDIARLVPIIIREQRDAEERHARLVAEEQLLYHANHDSLTGLINRQEFELKLEKALSEVRHEQHDHALMYLDLDQFKMINDSYGHAAGDELLKKLSASLRVHVRGTDTLARLGGDEFGILLYSCSLDKARLIADGLRQLVEDFRFIWKGKTLRVGVSIGLVEIDNSWKDLTEVLNAADTACYIAKDSGRNRIHVYRLEDAENQGRNGEMQMIQNIQYALEQGSFELFQQTISPLISTKQHVKHCEVLTRMRTEAGDVINAEDYVPTAERYRLMPQIDRWVVRATIHAMHFNHPSLTDMDLVSINISAQSLSDERFLQYILELLAENNVRADRLCFEISEASYLNNQGRADVFINRLRDRGCRFALDNFGAVSSVFNTLKTIDMDYLKIDGAFVQDIVDDEMERNMVESINHMGHRIGMRTVVQHISDQKTLDVIREMGVDFAQGYCIEQPHPISDLQVMAGD